LVRGRAPPDPGAHELRHSDGAGRGAAGGPARAPPSQGAARASGPMSAAGFAEVEPNMASPLAREVRHLVSAGEPPVQNQRGEAGPPLARLLVQRAPLAGLAPKPLRRRHAALCRVGPKAVVVQHLACLQDFGAQRLDAGGGERKHRGVPGAVHSLHELSLMDADATRASGAVGRGLRCGAGQQQRCASSGGRWGGTGASWSEAAGASWRGRCCRCGRSRRHSRAGGFVPARRGLVPRRWRHGEHHAQALAHAGLHVAPIRTEGELSAGKLVGVFSSGASAPRPVPGRASSSCWTGTRST